MKCKSNVRWLFRKLREAVMAGEGEQQGKGGRK